MAEIKLRNPKKPVTLKLMTKCLDQYSRDTLFAIHRFFHTVMYMLYLRLGLIKVPENSQMVSILLSAGA